MFLRLKSPRHRPTIFRRPLLVLVTALVGLTFPAAAMAADVLTTTGVAKEKGFRLSLRIVQGGVAGYGGVTPNTVSGSLTKKSGHATQLDDYGFFHGIDFTAASDLSSATVTGTFADGRGSISMTFHATGPLVNAGGPKGCSRVPQQERRGVLKGSYTLHADRLGTIRQKSFMATLSTTDYSGWIAPIHGLELFTYYTGRPSVLVSKPSPTGRVSEMIQVSKGRDSTDWGITYSYLVTGLPSSDYRVGSRLSTAKVTGGGGISGTATYSGTKGASTPRHSHSKGTVAGILAVTMAAIGRVTPFAKGARRAGQSFTPRDDHPPGSSPD
jgi:hypothetical protein